MAATSRTVHLAVDVEQLGPVAADPSAVVTGLINQISARHIVWAGTGIKQTAYLIRDVREEAPADAH